jgi:hypothetical protein
MSFCMMSKSQERKRDHSILGRVDLKQSIANDGIKSIGMFFYGLRQRLWIWGLTYAVPGKGHQRDNGYIGHQTKSYRLQCNMYVKVPI